jgi:hypothetical protein
MVRPDSSMVDLGLMADWEVWPGVVNKWNMTVPGSYFQQVSYLNSTARCTSVCVAPAAGIAALALAWVCATVLVPACRAAQRAVGGLPTLVLLQHNLRPCRWGSTGSP